MIKKVKKLKVFGIFQNFVAKPDLFDFAKFNLFYGWNGSGKTTWSRLFSALAARKLPDNFPSAEFELVLDDGTIIKHSNIGNFNQAVFVFNQQFVEDNIDWKKQGAKSIIVIAEDKIEERKRFFEIRDKILPLKRITAESKATLFAASEKERDSFLTDQARALKQSFQLIDTSDKRYLNYDRTKLKDFIRTNEEAIKKPGSILDAPALEKLRKQARPVEKPAVQCTLPQVTKEKLKEAESRINELLAKTVVTQSISRLQENAGINNWVEEGLKIHEEHKSSTCEFCGRPLSDLRMELLRQHFSHAYKELMDKLQKAKEWLVGLTLGYAFPEFGDLYDELQEEYKAALQDLQKKDKSVNDVLSYWIKALEDKLGNPFEPIQAMETGIESLASELLARTRDVEAVVNKHNEKTANFKATLDKVKSDLELHYVSQALKEKKYFDLVVRIAKEGKEVEAANKAVFDAVEEMTKLEASLANVAKGADDFNKQLHAFLGRRDISLQYDANQKGYMIRRGKGAAAVNLSEGEKTAIAFIYFIIKLAENGNDIKKSIVVIDDPISSFDANHLFHSLAFLKATCEEAMQLFILTHNFNYFKLVRDWLMNKNDYKKNSMKARLFCIEVDKGDPRSASISNAHDSLGKYGSEYHYLFTRLRLFRDDSKLDLDSSYQVANYSRKLLEAFFSFKHPKGRANFAQLMEVGCKEGKVDSQVRDKVYRFINKYSHYQLIDFGESPVDNLLAEGENITAHVFDILKACDAIHHAEMEEMCN